MTGAETAVWCAPFYFLHNRLDQSPLHRRHFRIARPLHRRAAVEENHGRGKNRPGDSQRRKCRRRFRHHSAACRRALRFRHRRAHHRQSRVGQARDLRLFPTPAAPAASRELRRRNARRRHGRGGGSQRRAVRDSQFARTRVHAANRRSLVLHGGPPARRSCPPM